jgi:hypothetical protein
METTQLPQGEISGAVLLYNSPEPLSQELHGKLGVKRLDYPFAFASTAQLVPLTVTEFQPAGLTYPVIFLGSDYTPVAVMGLREGVNLFLPANAQIDPEAYVPAYVRRYPFVFANDKDGERMILCIDRKAELIDENGGDTPLFEGAEPSEYTKNAMEFCREFENERRRTDDFVNLLKSLDLFEVKQAMFTPTLPDGSNGEPQLMAEYFAVSEAKLAALPPERVADMFKNGALQQVYAHLMSLLNWQRLVTRTFTMASQGQLVEAANQ